MNPEVLTKRTTGDAAGAMSNEQAEGMAVMLGILVGTGISLVLWVPLIAAASLLWPR